VLLECCGARIRLQLLVSSVCLVGDWTEVCLLSSAESLLCEALSEFCCSCHVRIGLQLLVRPVSLTFEGLLVCWTGAHADSSYCVERRLYKNMVSLQPLCFSSFTFLISSAGRTGLFDISTDSEWRKNVLIGVSLSVTLPTRDYLYVAKN
jgi:hypothetical protein